MVALCGFSQGALALSWNGGTQNPVDNNWGDVTFKGVNDVQISHSEKITIGTLADDGGTAGDSLKITANGNDFEIFALPISMHHSGGNLELSGTGDVNITDHWNPANTTTKISAKVDQDTTFTSKKTFFYDHASYNSTVTIENFDNANLGNVIFGQKGYLILNNISDGHMTLQSADRSHESWIELDKTTLEVTSQTDMGRWDLHNGSNLTINGNHKVEQMIAFLGSGNELTMNGDLEVQGQVINNHNQVADLLIKAQGNNVSIKEVELGFGGTNSNDIDGATSTLNIQGADNLSIDRVDFSNDLKGESVLTINANNAVINNVDFLSGKDRLIIAGGNVTLGKITTGEGAFSVIELKGTTTTTFKNGTNTIDYILGNSATSTLILDNSSLNVGSSEDALTKTETGVSMPSGWLEVKGITGNEIAYFNRVVMGGPGQKYTNLGEVTIDNFDLKYSTGSTSAELTFEQVQRVNLKFDQSTVVPNGGNGSDSNKQYTLTFNLGNGNVGGTAQLDFTSVESRTDAMSLNVKSSVANPQQASQLGKIFFKNDFWGQNTVNLQKGGWLSIADDSWNAIPTIDQAISAYADQGKIFQSVVTLGGTSRWVDTQKLGSEGSVLFVVNGKDANADNALLTDIGQNAIKFDGEVGFYLDVANKEFSAGQILKIADGDWTQYNEQAVGANNLFTEWVVKSDNDELNFELKDFHSVTEVLPDVIPKETFGEIYGQAVTDELGQKTWKAGVGVDQLTNPVTGETGVGGPLAEAIMAGGMGDADLTTEIANTFAAMGVVGGAQAGAGSVSQMSADVLARHYSFASTTGVNPLETHQPGSDLWVDATYMHDKTRSLSNGAGEYGNRTNLRGFALGLDNTLDENLTIGGVFNYVKGRTDANTDFMAIDNDTESYGLAAWVGWNVNNKCNLVADISYARGKNELNSALTGLMAESFTATYAAATTKPAGWGDEIGTDVKADIDTETFSLGARAEHVIRTNYVDIIPHIGVRWDHIKTDAYALKIDGRDAVHTETDDMNVFSVPVGVSVAKSHHDTKTGWNSRISADAYVMPRFGDTDADVSSRFAGYTAVDSGSMEVMSDLAYGVSVGAQVYSKRTSVGFNAGVNGSDRNTSVSVNANVIFRF